MTHCRQKVFQFQGLNSRKVTVDFTGGYLSSEGGGPILREMELRHRIIRNKRGHGGFLPLTKQGCEIGIERLSGSG